ncbi:MAG: sulfotransferase family 2 domain-containing protein [Litoreibacter sp.]
MKTPLDAKPNAQLRQLFTSRVQPIHYLVIPKCGCTFVKNFLWTLESDRPHAKPIRIHDDDRDFLRADAAGLSVEDIVAREHAFTVLRNPIDRFFSLYSDKVVGDGWREYVPLREILAKNHGLDPEVQSIDGHRRNCEIMINWIGRNLNTPQEIENEAHWTPQSFRRELMDRFQLKLLLLNKLDQQLPVLLRDILPNVDQVMDNLERNKTTPQFARNEILDHGLRRKINKVYSSDLRLFNQTRKLWEERDPQAASDVPRFGDVVAT